MFFCGTLWVRKGVTVMTESLLKKYDEKLIKGIQINPHIIVYTNGPQKFIIITSKNFDSKRNTHIAEMKRRELLMTSWA